MKANDFFYQLKRLEGKPWLIFLHGLFGSAQNWRRITPSFEESYSILTYDQRGHGRSFKPESGYAPEDYANDLKFLMSELSIPRASVIGHSMGGRNAMCFARMYPELITKLVVEDIGPQPSIISGSSVIEKLKALPKEFENKRAAKEFLLNQFGDPQIGMFMYSNVLTDETGKGHWAFSLDAMIETVSVGRGSERWGDLRGIKCPTLVIRGEKSEELTPDEFAQMKSENKLVQGVEIKGAGHWVHFEKPIEFIDQLQRFLNS